MLALKALIGVIAYLASPVSAHGEAFSLRTFQHLASDTPVAASQLSVQLVAARFKGAGIVPVRILSFLLSVDLSVGFLAPK